MATRIKLKRSTTAAVVPTTSNLEDGEVALNIQDRKLYARNGSNIIEVANQKPNTGEVTTTMFATDVTNGPGNTFYVASTGTNNDTLPNGGNNGKHADTPFLTITKALSVASSGDTIFVAPGEYQEVFPMTVPDGVTLRGANLRSTSVKPTGATNDNNAFILSGDCHVSDLTVKDFYYNSGADEGYAFVVVSNMDSTTSPYVERCTVNTKGSVVSGSDPYGYTQGDAGRGAKLDGANVASSSQHASVLFNECTFITPNQVGLKITNGMRVEWLNCFNYFASIGIEGAQGSTGRAGAGRVRIKLGGTSGTVNPVEILYQLEDSFQSGTYARSGSIVTVTRTGHGLVTGDYIYADHISGSATDGFEPVTVVDANTFTYDNSASGTTSGNITYKKAVARLIIGSNDGTYVYSVGGNKGSGEFTTVNKPTKTLSRFGDSQLSTAQKKFGTASILLDGTEDNVIVPTDEDFGFGSANFCIEGFIRPSSVTGTQRIFDLRDNSATDTAPTVYLDGTTLHYAVGNTSQINGGTLATNTWYHVAVARSNGTTRLFLDGTQLGTYTDNNDYGTTKPVIIGANYEATPAEAFNGYVDEVRISKAAARFTSGFTPTTSEYGSDLNTVLLLHANGDDASTTFTDVSGGISDIRTDGGDSATSVITTDYSEFGAELRSVASACVYGQKGVQADGSGVKLILTAHNFGYVGSGDDFTNDPSLAIQANEVVEQNGGRVLYSSTDQDGDFRVGDAFTVDQETGNVQFQATSSAQSAANITLSDATGTTNIFPAYIETGNLRFAGNSMTSTTGQVIVDPAGEEDFVVNAETIVKEAVYFDVNKSISFGSTIQGALKIAGFGGSTVFGSSEASSFSTRSFVLLKNGLGTVNLTGAGSGYLGGQQTVDVTTNPFQLAQATAVLDTSGGLKTFTVTTRGSGYTALPTVTIDGSGNGAATAAFGVAGDIRSVTITNGGSNYASPTGAIDAPPLNTFTGGGTYEDANEVSYPVVDTSANTIYIPSHTFETGMQANYDATTLDATATAIGGLTTGTAYYAIRVDQNLLKLASSEANANAGNAISLTSQGSGDQFFQGRQATVNVGQTGGVIDTVTVTDIGSGYGSQPDLTITDSAGSNAQFTVNVGRAINAISVDQIGSYPSAPNITFVNASGDTTGSGAAATVTLAYGIASVTLNNQGLGYRNLPTLTADGTPTAAATFTVILNEQEGRIGSVIVNNGGAGYDTAPTLTFTGGGGFGGQLLADVQSLTGNITANGSGYAPGVYPDVGFTVVTSAGTVSTVATATFTVPGFNGTITTAGSGYADGTYTSVPLVNTPTATYTVTVVTRDKIDLSGDPAVVGTPAVGNTVTNGTGGSATVTYVASDLSFVYVTGTSGSFADADSLSFSGSGATATATGFSTGGFRYVIDLGSGAQEAPSFTLLDNNTYKFDTSDSSNTGHPLTVGAVANLVSRQVGTPGQAGSYFELTLGAVSASATSLVYSCETHGATMSEDSTITVAAGAVGNGGSGMLATVVVSGGAVTSVTITAQGTNYSLNNVLIVDDSTVGGGGGSNFQFTLSSSNTGISSVTNISLSGAGYTIGDVLSVDDATVGGGGGSSFQYTVTNVGFVVGLSVNLPGAAYEASDTLILGPVGGEGAVQGTGFAATIATIASTKQLEMDQLGLLTLGPTIGDQLALEPNGTITAKTTTGTVSNPTVSTRWSISPAGATVITSLDATTGTFSGVFAAQSTSTFTGLATFNGGITTAGVTTLVQTSALFADGNNAAPSIAFDNSTSTGIFRSSANVIGISNSGTEKYRFSADTFDAPAIQVDGTLGSTAPFFKVDPTVNKVLIGPATNFLSLDNTNTLKSEGSNVAVPLNFETKGSGNFVFKGGTDVDFSITDGTTEKFKIETSTGDLTIGGNLDAGVLRIRDNVVSNNSSTASRAFGQIVSLAVTGSGSGYTNGTYTATATTSNGIGVGLTVTVTVSGGDFSTVTIVDKGRNYKVGDTITITAAGGGTGRSVTVTSIDGQGVVIKPIVGSSAMIDTTGSLVIPSGTTNQRPDPLDRLAGAIRFNTEQLQFEGYNGSDFVSLGGVRDVDQDTYILTEASPGTDEDTFEFYNAGFNSLSIDKDRFILKTTRIIDVQGVLNIDGVASGQDTVDFKSSGASIAKIRSSKDFEITSGLRLRNVGVRGTITGIGTVTSSSGAYTASNTFTAVASTTTIEGTGATFDVVIDGSGNVSSVAINSGGTLYEVDEVLTINGTLLGGASPANDVSFAVTTIGSTSPAFARMDILQQDYITQMDSKPFLSFDANGAEAGFKINRGWNAGSESYLTVFDSTATFMELDDCRVEGGQLASFPTSATIVAFDRNNFKGSKTLVTIESDDNKVHMFEVTIVCASNGTTAHATVTNSITSDNNLMDTTVSVVGSNVNISLAKSSAATSSSNFTGRFTTTKVKA